MFKEAPAKGAKGYTEKQALLAKFEKLKKGPLTPELKNTIIQMAKVGSGSPKALIDVDVTKETVAALCDFFVSSQDYQARAAVLQAFSNSPPKFELRRILDLYTPKDKKPKIKGDYETEMVLKILAKTGDKDAVYAVCDFMASTKNENMRNNVGNVLLDKRYLSEHAVTRLRELGAESSPIASEMQHKKEFSGKKDDMRDALTAVKLAAEGVAPSTKTAKVDESVLSFLLEPHAKTPNSEPKVDGDAIKAVGTLAVSKKADPALAEIAFKALTKLTDPRIKKWLIKIVKMDDDRKLEAIKAIERIRYMHFSNYLWKFPMPIPVWNPIQKVQHMRRDGFMKKIKDTVDNLGDIALSEEKPTAERIDKIGDLIRELQPLGGKKLTADLGGPKNDKVSRALGILFEASLSPVPEVSEKARKTFVDWVNSVEALGILLEKLNSKSSSVEEKLKALEFLNDKKLARDPDPLSPADLFKQLSPAVLFMLDGLKAKEAEVRIFAAEQLADFINAHPANYKGSHNVLSSSLKTGEFTGAVGGLPTRELSYDALKSMKQAFDTETDPAAKAAIRAALESVKTSVKDHAIKQSKTSIITESKASALKQSKAYTPAESKDYTLKEFLNGYGLLQKEVKSKIRELEKKKKDEMQAFSESYGFEEAKRKYGEDFDEFVQGKYSVKKSKEFQGIDEDFSKKLAGLVRNCSVDGDWSHLRAKLSPEDIARVEKYLR